ncbi:MAG: glycine cleavage system protein GcvH [Caldilineaceae bacterium]|nr:glycine cleavage system protein GcvH [Caldilineaceae bacterium]
MASFKLDKKARYAETHEWVRIENDLAVVGISDAAQDMLSDVVFVELPEVGEEVSAGDAIATVESVKAAEEVVAPVSGTVVEVNAELEETPEMVNESPYKAWFFKIQPSDRLQKELSALMSPDDYDTFVDENEH